MVSSQHIGYQQSAKGKPSLNENLFTDSRQPIADRQYCRESEFPPTEERRG